MTPGIAEIWRHPIKAIGREALHSVTLAPNAGLPWDRVWAVRHEQSQAETDAWSRCVNFNRGASAPELMAITAKLDSATGIITLQHPKKPALTVNMAEDGQTLIDWLSDLVPPDRAHPMDVISVPNVALTDSAFPSVSLMSLASLRALSQRAGRSLETARFRGNVWVDGAHAWEEEEWVGKILKIGEAELKVEEPIVRCKATTVNTTTGLIDTDTLGLLDEMRGAREFGVNARVLKGGMIMRGDAIEVRA